LGGRGQQIGRGLFVTTDQAFAAHLLTQKSIEAIGQLEVSHLRNAPAVVYGSQEHDEASFAEAPVLLEWLTQAHSFLICLWLLKDNAATIEQGFLSYKVNGVDCTHSNAIIVSHFTANGSRAAVPFGRDELQQACAVFRAQTGAVLGHVPSGTVHTVGLGRLERGSYWIQAARSSADLGHRIACYCTAMEALLATSTAELAHQLAERAAVLLARTQADRLKTFVEVKRAYGMRSKIAHGDTLGSSQVNALIDVAVQCDCFVRQIIWEGITQTAFAEALRAGSKAMDAYFLQELFGKGSSQ